MYAIVLVLTLVAMAAIVVCLVRPAYLLGLGITALIALGFAIVLGLTLTTSTVFHVH